MATSSSSILRVSFAVLVAAILLAVSLTAGSVHAATLNVDGADVGCDDVVGTPYCTISAAVADASAGDVINVFPGTYAESVDLSGMAAPGNIVLITVDSTGTPAPGTASVDPAAGGGPGTGAAIFNSVSPFPGNVTIDGFIVTSPDDDAIDVHVNSDVVIANVTASNAFTNGMNLDTDSGAVTVTNSTADGTTTFNGFNIRGGDVTVSGSTADANSANGFNIGGSADDVTVIDSSADGNGNDGFDIDAGGNVTVSGSTANDNGDDGFNIGAPVVTITGSTANNNGGDGFDVDDAGDVSVTGSTANGNGVGDSDHGFDIDGSGPVDISDSAASDNADDGINVNTSGNVTVTDSTANSNGDEGIEIDTGGSVILDGITANSNADDGADIECFDVEVCDLVDNVTVKDSVFIGNGSSGIDFDKDNQHETAGAYLVNGNIICDNTGNGFEQSSDIATNAEGNWWGDASGPQHPVDNASGSGDAIVNATNATTDDGDDTGMGTTDFDPWIDSISGTGASATQGQPTVVTFEFTDTSVALTDGPGDPNGAPTFSATTDNGAVSTSGFISGGKLEVTLTPEKAGTATVTVTGPCGLEGESDVLDVVAAPVAATPTPAPVELPPSGSEPGSDAGGGTLTIALLAIAGAFALVSGGGILVAVRRRR